MAGEPTRTFSYEPDAARTRIFHYDVEKDDGSFIIETIQQIDELANANQYIRSEASTDWKGEFVRVASIPMNVLEDMKRKGVDPYTEPERFAKWLDDSENQVFRTKAGRLWRKPETKSGWRRVSASKVA
jgi:hypothetical protein